MKLIFRNLKFIISAIANPSESSVYFEMQCDAELSGDAQ
jgi:hypothetical protein